MKILSFSTALFVAALILGTCGKESKKHVKEADTNIKLAGENLKEAAKDADYEAVAKATADWQAFKSESDRSIAAMEKQTGELKVKIDQTNGKTKAKLSTELNKLQQKLNEQKARLNKRNAEFEIGIKNSSDTLTARNESFKAEFKHDMSELGSAFNNLFSDNVK